MNIIGEVHDFDFVTFIQRQPELVFLEQRSCFHRLFAYVADCWYRVHVRYGTLAVRARQAKPARRNRRKSGWLTMTGLPGVECRTALESFTAAGSGRRKTSELGCDFVVQAQDRETQEMNDVVGAENTLRVHVHMENFVQCPNIPHAPFPRTRLDDAVETGSAEVCISRDQAERSIGRSFGAKDNC